MLLNRRTGAEFLGTCLLVMAVVGSGLMAGQLTGDSGLQLLANAVATGGALFALITIFSSVSGASFNPIVTMIDAVLSRRIGMSDLAVVSAQVLGAISGSVLANLMFAHPWWETSDKIRTGGPQWLSEVIATFGLVLVIFGCLRTGQAQKLPLLVASWITGAYWFTSSTSLANPAVTIGRMFSKSFAGIAPESVPMFVAMQVVGGIVGFVVVICLWPQGAKD